MLKKTLGDLTGREFHWGLVAQMGVSAIGDIISSNAAKAQQAQAAQFAEQQTQQAMQEQQELINQAAAKQRTAYTSAASAGNPMLQAAALAKPPAAPAPLPGTPNVPAASFGGPGGGMLQPQSVGAPSRPQAAGYLAPPPGTFPGQAQQPLAAARPMVPQPTLAAQPPQGYLTGAPPQSPQRVSAPLMRGAAG